MVRRDALLVLDLMLHVRDRVRRLHFQRDRLTRQRPHEHLSAAAAPLAGRLLGLGFAPAVACVLAALAPLLSVKSPLAVTTPLTLGMLARVIAPVSISVYNRAATPAAAGLLPALAAPLSVRTPAIVAPPLLLIVVTCIDASVAA